MTRSPLWLVLVALLGCSPPGEDHRTDVVTFDLVAELEYARILGETGRLDIGTTSARGYLSGAWSWNERDGEGNSFVWAGPDRSEIAFFLAAPRPISVRFRCLPYRGPDGEVDGMSIELNDFRAGRVDLEEGWRTYELELPVTALVAGVNRLGFDHRWSVESSPAEETEEDQEVRSGRRVAVAWDWIELPGDPSRRPEAETSTGSLNLTPGSRIDYFFHAPSDAELVIETISQQGEEGGAMVISSLQDGGTQRQLLEFDGWHRGRPLQGQRKRHRSLPLKEPPNRWSLDVSAGLVRLRLESTGSFELFRPRIVSRSAPATGHPATSGHPRSWPATEPQLVLLYVIDAFRADHLGSIAVNDSRTPGFSTFLQDAVLFENALAQSSWTKPTVASILTGQPPWGHGAEDSRDTLSGDLASLPARMQQIGYRTAAFSANGFVSPTFGFHHGFEHFVLSPETDTPSPELHTAALEWLAEQAEAPAFVYIHAIDPHAPYAPTEPFRSRFLSQPAAEEIGSVAHLEGLAQTRRQPTPAEMEAITELYAAEIAYADQEFSRLIASLEDLGLYETSLIVVMSDHGEEFYEHGSWTHGRTLYPEVLDIPLMIKFPHSWGAGIRITDPVQQIDLLPTLEEFFAMPGTSKLPGSSLLCAVQRAVSGETLECETSRSRPIFSSLDYYNNHWVGVILDDWKLILPGADRLAGDAHLYNRRSDRDEHENVARHHPVQVGYLSALIRHERRRRSLRFEPDQAELDAETEARLKALGYLE